MGGQSGTPRSQLYLLRVWIGPGPAGGRGWQGKLQPVPGEGSYCFADTSEFLALLDTLRAVSATAPDGSDDAAARLTTATPEPSAARNT